MARVSPTDYTSEQQFAVVHPRFYNMAEGAERLRISERALRDGINHRGWPHSRIGRRLVVSENDLNEIYRLHRVPSRSPVRGRRSFPEALCE